MPKSLRNWCKIRAFQAISAFESKRVENRGLRRIPVIRSAPAHLAKSMLFVGIVLLLVTVMAWPPVAVADDCVIGPDWKIDSVTLPRAKDRKVSDYVELGDIIAVKCRVRFRGKPG